MKYKDSMRRFVGVPHCTLISRYLCQDPAERFTL